MKYHLIDRHIRPLSRAMAALALGAAAAGVASVSVVPARPANAASTLVVDANQPFRTATHVATGSLYGLATATVPTQSLAQAINPNTFVQMATGGHQQAEGDVLAVAPTAAAIGAHLVDRMSDYYAGWPYQFSWSTWPTVVQQQVQKVEASAYAGITDFELWNEPDNTWLSSNGTFNSFWTTTFNQVRSLDPSAVIQGPSFSDNISGMQSFLANAVATNTVPNIITWHELESAGKIAGDVATVTGIEKSLGITPRPIAIEEYAAPSQVGIPGDLIDYIAQFERLGISNAELAFWNGYGALGDLLTGTGGSPNAAYWLYQWYGQMSGSMVTVVPPGTAGTGLDGAAAVNSAGNQVSVIFGGGSGSTAVTVNGLSSLSAFGSSAHAVLEQTVSAGPHHRRCRPADHLQRRLHHQQRVHHRTGQFHELRQRLPPRDHTWQRQLHTGRDLPDQERAQRAGIGHTEQRHGAGNAGRPGDPGQQQHPEMDPYPRELRLLRDQEQRQRAGARHQQREQIRRG